MGFRYSGEPLPASMNPKPDTFPSRLASREYEDVPRLALPSQQDRVRRRIGRVVLDAFWLDMGFAHHSASMQTMAGHPLHSLYMDKARENRERLNADRRREAKHLARQTAPTLQVRDVLGDGRERVLP